MCHLLALLRAHHILHVSRIRVKGMTAWHITAEIGKCEILHKIWEWAKELLTRVDLIRKKFLAKDKVGNTAWHVAVYMGNLDS